jgi:hypothetical protein
MKIHYCILTIERNGLREIRTVDDTEFMLTFVSIGDLYLHIYLDHDESLRHMNWDDVVQFPIIELPPVTVCTLKTSNNSMPPVTVCTLKPSNKEQNEETKDQ